MKVKMFGNNSFFLKGYLYLYLSVERYPGPATLAKKLVAIR